MFIISLCMLDELSAILPISRESEISFEKHNKKTFRRVATFRTVLSELGTHGRGYREI